MFVLFFNNFFVPCWKFGSPYLGNHSSRKSSATQFYKCVQYFRVYGCQYLGFLTWAQMLMHAIAHGVCMGTVTESALKVDSRIIIIKKKTKTKRGLEPASVLRLAFQSDALPTELSPPRIYGFKETERRQKCHCSS